MTSCHRQIRLRRKIPNSLKLASRDPWNLPLRLNGNAALIRGIG